MSAFEIGLLMGMFTFIYVVFELIKYEPQIQEEKVKGCQALKVTSQKLLTLTTSLQSLWGFILYI